MHELTKIQGEATWGAIDTWNSDAIALAQKWDKKIESGLRRRQRNWNVRLLVFL